MTNEERRNLLKKIIACGEQELNYTCVILPNGMKCNFDFAWTLVHEGIMTWAECQNFRF